MTGHPDDIRRYIRLTDNTDRSDIGNELLENLRIPSMINPELLLEDVNDIIFRFRSYNERDGSEDYAQGVEEGLSLAAQMLERLLERYSSNLKDEG